MPARDLTRWKQNEDGTWNLIKPGNGNVATVEEEPESYESWTKDQLSAELESRDLPKTGNKDELIARLEEADSA